MDKFDNTYQAVVSKLEQIQEYMVKMQPFLKIPDKEILGDDRTLPAVERYFQLIVDAAIDINTAIIKKNDIQASLDYQGTFDLMSACSALPADLASAIAPSVGLRNALVHVYEKLDKAKVIHDIKRNIGQYREYMSSILSYVEKMKKPASLAPRP